MERLVAWLVVFVTVIAALALGYRQLQVRRWLKAHEVSLSPEDIAYHRWSIVRRLIGCAMLLLLGGLIAGIYVFDIANGLEELNALGNKVKGTDQKLTPEQESFVYFSLRYVIVLLLVLMLIFFLAGWDILAIRRFGARHRQRIRDDRRAMLERQLPILYAERKAMEEEGKQEGR
jgi:hypothetical protein